jgi:hypothetical protein
MTCYKVAEERMEQLTEYFITYQEHAAHNHLGDARIVKTLSHDGSGGEQTALF